MDGGGGELIINYIDAHAHICGYVFIYGMENNIYIEPVLSQKPAYN